VPDHYIMGAKHHACLELPKLQEVCWRSDKYPVRLSNIVHLASNCVLPTECLNFVCFRLNCNFFP